VHLFGLNVCTFNFATVQACGNFGYISELLGFILNYVWTVELWMNLEIRAPSRLFAPVIAMGSSISGNNNLSSGEFMFNLGM